MTPRRYAKYREAPGWVGSLPAEWRHSPLWAIASCNDDVLPEGFNPEEVIQYIEISNVAAGRGITDVTEVIFADAPSRARRRVRDGDVLVSTVRTYLRAIASVKSPPENLIASTGFAVLRPRQINADFLGYAVQAEYFISEVIARSVGVSYPAINASDLMRINVPFPPPTEQSAIAAFLDRETGKIDALVEEQRRLIELLKEKRQAVISHAVTKGLDPNVRMKPSGVEWLGDVPEHWNVTRLRFIARLNPSKSEIELPEEESVSFLSMDAIGEDGSLRLDEKRPISQVQMGYTYFREGDVTVAKITPCFENGKGALMSGLIGGIGFGTTELTVIRPEQSRLDRQFLAWITQSRWFRAGGEGAMYGAGGQKRVPDNFIRNFAVALPPLCEQRAISASLHSKCDSFDRLIAEANTLVDVLHERRSALISAAVTGKIDVRNSASEEKAA